MPPNVLAAFEISLAPVSLLKAITLACALISVIMLFTRRDRTSRFLIWQALLVVLLTPYALTTWVPKLDAMTITLYEQNQQIVKHVEQNFPNVQAQWKRNIPIMPDRPSTLGISLKIEDSRLFQPASWDYLLLEVLGYRNNFLAFVSKGWILSLVTLIFALLGLYIKVSSFPEFFSDLRWLSLQIAIIISFILISTLGVNILDHNLETWLVNGAYSKVVRVSQMAEKLYPTLKYDEKFQERIAQAEFSMDIEDPFRFALAKGIEQYHWGEYEIASESLQKALDYQSKSFLAKRYLAASILNRGVDYFETPILPNRPSDVRFPSTANFLESPKARQGPIRAKPSGAITSFEKVLKVFPGHLGALYDLMLTHSINSNFEQSSLVAQQLIDSQTYFQHANMALLGQTYTHFAWEAYHEKDLDTAWKRYQQSVNPGLWADH
ncbi:MAG: hypothetical protein AAGA83_00710 [Cyanobacteria bacterium P01_F01_bin.116]